MPNAIWKNVPAKDRRFTAVPRNQYKLPGASDM